MLLALFAGIVLSALFSGLETGIYTTSRLRLFLDEQAGVTAAGRARRLLRDMPSLLTVLLVSNNLANWLASFSAQALLIAAGVGAAEAVGTVVVSLLLFVFSESVPKSAFRQARERLLYPSLPILLVVRTVLGPLVAPITWFAGRLAARVADRTGSARGRESVFDAGVSEGFLTPFQERVARGILAMRTRTAGSAAVPLGGFPSVRLDSADVLMPAETREHRLLVLDRLGQRVLGWVPLASLWKDGGFRPPQRAELRPVIRVGADTALDVVYVQLDKGGVPFAVLPDGRVLDGDRLRRAVMGTLSEGPAAA